MADGAKIFVTQTKDYPSPLLLQNSSTSWAASNIISVLFNGMIKATTTHKTLKWWNLYLLQNWIASIPLYSGWLTVVNITAVLSLGSGSRCVWCDPLWDCQRVSVGGNMESVEQCWNCKQDMLCIIVYGNSLRW